MAGNSNLAELGVVVNESWYDKQAQEKKERAHFVDVTFWGQPADFACQYLKKGDKVLIEGALDMQTWDDRDTGKKRSKLKLKGRRIQSLMTKDATRQEQPQQRAPQAPQAPPPPPFPAGDNIPGLDDEAPF
jgi:single stranded DNA-binding protein